MNDATKMNHWDKIRIEAWHGGKSTWQASCIVCGWHGEMQDANDLARDEARNHVCAGSYPETETQTQ